MDSTSTNELQFVVQFLYDMSIMEDFIADGSTTEALEEVKKKISDFCSSKDDFNALIDKLKMTGRLPSFVAAVPAEVQWTNAFLGAAFPLLENLTSRYGLPKQEKRPCPICAEILHNKIAFKRHVRDAHPKGPFTCRQCSRSVERKDNFLRHMKNCNKA